MSFPQRQALRDAIRDGQLELTDQQASAVASVWELWARQEQIDPPGDWRTWYVRGGRGTGKTRTGAETLANWIRDTILDGEPGDWAIVAPTFGDARDVGVEGPSGLLNALGGEGGPLVPKGGWNRSHGELFLASGARVFADGADDGALRVQGKNLRGAWCDEIGLWRVGHWQTAWNESIAFAVRLAPARIVATGTPKQGHPLVKHLLTSPRVAVTLMRLADNVANLHPDAVADLYARFAGGRLGRQELEGEYLEDAPGALWTLDLIDRHRVDQAPATLTRVAVGVDPSGAADEDTGNAETGIVACGYSADLGHAFVLADRSVLAGPETWARRAVSLYHEVRADVLVAERNFGGDMVRATIHAIDPNVHVRLVTASRGKAVRAEPVAVKYDQGRVYHVGLLPDLESQMTSWNPSDPTMPSPDRVDALVWALTELTLGRDGATTVRQSHLDEAPRTIRIGDMTVGEEWIDEPAGRRNGQDTRGRPNLSAV